MTPLRSNLHERSAQLCAAHRLVSCIWRFWIFRAARCCQVLPSCSLPEAGGLRAVGTGGGASASVDSGEAANLAPLTTTSSTWERLLPLKLLPSVRMFYQPGGGRGVVLVEFRFFCWQIGWSFQLLLAFALLIKALAYGQLGFSFFLLISSIEQE